MAFAEKTFYVALCDGCGREHESDEYAAWSDQEGAFEAAREYDWHEQDDGRLLCGECRLKPGGDLAEKGSGG